MSKLIHVGEKVRAIETAYNNEFIKGKVYDTCRDKRNKLWVILNKYEKAQYKDEFFKEHFEFIKSL